MIELIKFLVGEFIGEEKFAIDQNEDEIIVYIEKDSMGAIIGKSGKIVKAIRTIMRSKNFKDKSNYKLTIKERE